MEPITFGRLVFFFPKAEVAFFVISGIWNTTGKAGLLQFGSHFLLTKTLH